MTVPPSRASAPPFDLHIVCRLSVKEAADGESLEAQVALAKEHAQRVLGCARDDLIFVEQPEAQTLQPPAGKRIVKVSSCYVSGGTQWDERLDLQDVMNDARAGRCRAILTPNLDRVARNVEVAERFRRELLNHGVRALYEGTTFYDLTNDNQQLLYGLRAQFSAWERQVITKRMFDGHIRAVREGFYAGGNIPVGTQLQPTGLRAKGREYRVVVDHREMDVVRQLFQRRADGWTVRQLEAWTRQLGVSLNPHHYRSTSPGFSFHLIQRILRNPFYVTGRLSFTVKAPRWPAETIEQQIDIGQPVTQDLFDEVGRIQDRRAGTRQPAGTYLLSGLVYHVESKTPFLSAVTLANNRHYRYYRNAVWGKARRQLFNAGRLSKAEVTPDGARQVIFASIHKDRLEALVMQELLRFRENPELIDQLMELDQAGSIRQAPRNDDVYLHKLAEVEAAQADLRRFLDAVAGGFVAMTSATAEKHRQLEAAVASLERDAAALRKERRRPKSQSNRAARLKNLVDVLPDVLKHASPGDQAAFVKATVHRVWVDNLGGVTVELAIDPGRARSRGGPQA
jgi:DNA invertase Pin-like site-specific DNA recombinase